MEHRTAGKQNANGTVIQLNCKSRLRVLKCELVSLYFGIARGVNNC